MTKDRLEAEDLPIAVIGAGPVGLAAAAELIERGMKLRVYEAGSEIATNVRDWNHVRLFSPWRHDMADAAARLLTARRRRAPDPAALPTGNDPYRRYLKPRAEIPDLAAPVDAVAKAAGMEGCGCRTAA